jgi:hypothetical protein
LDRISIELTDDMTLGALRTLAKSTGKRLVISLDGAERSARADGGATRGRATATPAAPARNGRRRRKLSPKARAALARNLVKARAARSANAKAARVAKG